jgi:hypothetical protein
MSGLPLGPRPQGVRAAHDPLQGQRLGEDGPRGGSQIEGGRTRQRCCRPRVRWRCHLGRERFWIGRLVGERFQNRRLLGPWFGVGGLFGERFRGNRNVEGLKGGALDRLRRAPNGLTMPGSASDWISLAEAAAILEAANIRFRPSTIGGWARSGRLQSIKLGGRRFVRRGEVRALVAAPRRVRAEDLQPGLFGEIRD